MSPAEFNEFAKKNYNRHLKYVKRLLYNSNVEAEDVLQESYLQAFVTLDRYDETRAGFNTWFNVIMFSVLRAFCKKDKKLVSGDSDDVVDMVEVYSLDKDIFAYPKSDRIKRILYLFYKLGYSSSEIARIEEVSVTSITSTCSRFRQWLKEKQRDDI